MSKGWKLGVNEVYQKIYETLKELLDLEDSIHMAILSDPTGELIHFASKSSDDETKVRMASATIAATFGGAQVLGEDFNLSEPKFLIYEFNGGNLIITRCEMDTSLSIIAGSDANLGTLRVLAKKYSEKLGVLIRELYSAMQEELKTANVDTSFE